MAAGIQPYVIHREPTLSRLTAFYFLCRLGSTGPAGLRAWELRRQNGVTPMVSISVRRPAYGSEWHRHRLTQMDCTAWL
jgi:hypothetical protein